MKGLKKIALASAIAAAPFVATAGGLQPLDDTTMSDVTGQAGVTIELSTQMTIDQVAYSQDTNGSFLIDDIRVGGFFGQNLDLSVDIDLEDNGDAVISLGTLDGNPVQLGMSVGAMGLSGDDGSATLISNFDMRMFLTTVDIRAQVLDLDGEAGGSGSLQIDAAFAIENLDVDFDVAAVSLEGFRMAGAGSLSDLQNGDITDIGMVSATNPAVVSMAIGAGSALSSADQDALRINLDGFQADIWMPTINVGGGSIGSVAISNLQVTDTQMAIYGRD